MQNERRPQPGSKGQSLAESDRKRLAAYVASVGDVKAASVLGVHRSSLVRALAGLGVYGGTARAISLGLDQAMVR